jgi:hypothetical protein
VQNPNPSFPPDTELQAKFPASIGGSPATDLSTGPFGAFLCLGGQATYNQAVAGLPGGVNWATVSVGSADYTIDGEDLQLTAFRTPGSDARAFVDALLQLARNMGNDVQGTLSNGPVGGKTAFIVTQPDGTKSYGYATGDTLFLIDEDATDAQAATMLAALP